MAVTALQYAYALARAPYEISSLFLNAIVFVVPALRPHPDWSYSQAVQLKLVRLVVLYISLLQLGDRLSLEPGREKDRFTVSDPAAAHFYKGPLDDRVVRPTQVGLTWTPAPPSAKDIAAGATVVLHFHGGAYVIGNGRDEDIGFLAKILLKSLGCSYVCTPQYRLSSGAAGHFPAALQDGVTAYLHLIQTMKIPSSQIVFSGDSAGANLALSLARYTHEFGPKLQVPSPAAITAWSPWVDVHDALVTDIASKRNSSTDYVSTQFARWGAKAFTEGGKLDAMNPYLSPLHEAIPASTHKTVLFIQTGGMEVLLEDDTLLAQRFRKAGWQVGFFVSDKCPHDILLLGHKLGFVKEARLAASEARKFLLEATTLRL